MESDERPAKLRKLVHDFDDGASEAAKPTVVSRDSSKERQPVTTNLKISTHETDASESEEVGESMSTLKPAPSIVTNGNGTEQPLSKNQQKKLRKREEWEAGRDYRKAKRKEKDAEKKARKREAREEAKASPALQIVPKRPRRPIRLPVTILIDCGFDDLMIEKERISLGSQLTRAYSDNHRATFQAHLVVSSWNGLLKHRFDNVLNKHYLNWKGVRFEEDDFAVVAQKTKGWMKGEAGGRLAGVFEKYGSESEELETTRRKEADGSSSLTLKDNREQTPPPEAKPLTEASPPRPNALVAEAADENFSVKDVSSQPPTPQGEIIYLTSDSPDTLTELKPYSTYIVGGLVDKNRHKGICYKSALNKGIKTAKLPIGEYMTMQSRFVLATNHVVEIMVKWLECGDWGQAFMQVIPKRKGGALKEDAEDEDL